MRGQGPGSKSGAISTTAAGVGAAAVHLGLGEPESRRSAPGGRREPGPPSTDAKRTGRNVAAVFGRALSNGGDDACERPTECRGWRIRELEEFSMWYNANGFALYVASVWGCECGVKNNERLTFPKRWAMLTTSKDVHCGVGNRSLGQRGRCEIVGTKVAASAACRPGKMRGQIARAWLKSRDASGTTLATPTGPSASYLASSRGCLPP